MNNRIKELAEEAGFIPGVMGLNRFTYFDPEKFAELIVGECAGIYSKIDNGNLHMGTDDYLEAVMKHFKDKE